MKLNKRQSILIKYLLKQSGYIIVNDLAQLVKVSSRTIYNDLINIEVYLAHKGYSVVKKPSKGIMIQKNIEIIKNDELFQEVDKYSINGRREGIFSDLFLKNKVITYEELSKEYMVSKSSIINDVKFIKKILKEIEGLEVISSKYGTQLKAKEEDIQKAILTFCQYQLKENINIMDNSNISLEYFKNYFGENVINISKLILYDFLKNNNDKIDEYYVSNILNTLIILVYRLSMNKHINDNFDNNKDFYYMSSKNILKKIILRLDAKVELSDKDINYFSVCLISNKFKHKKIENEYREIVENLMSQMSESLGINLLNDDILYKNLLLHIPAMIYRSEHNIKINNPLIQQIKNEFLVIFTIIGLVINNDMSNVLSYEENEVGFLTLHFQAAIERTSFNKKILVVCPLGIAISSVLYNRLIKILPIFTSIYQASIKELETQDVEQYDLVITTVNITKIKTKVVVVTPLLDEVDIKNILKNYNEILLLKKIDKKNENIQNSELKNYIKPEAIYVKKNIKSKDELLKIISKKLVNLKYVNSKYLDSILKREQSGTTELKAGIAIPHGSPDFVKKSVVLLLTLKNPIIWNEKLKIEVDIVFLLAIKKEDIKVTRNIVSNLYNMLEDQKTLTRLREASNKQIIQKVIEEENWNK